MTEADRKRYMMIALIGLLALFAADRLVLAPFLDMRSELLASRDAAERDLSDAKRTLQLEKELEPLHRSMAASVSVDSSAAESQLLHLLHQWQHRAGVANASFQRLHAMNAHGFMCLTFNVSATGGMGSVASLLYELETAEIPLRLDDVRLAPKRDGADELQLRLNISTLCRETPANPSRSSSVASTDLAGGRP